MSHVLDSKLRKKVEYLLKRAEGSLLGEAVLEKEGAHLAPAEAFEKLSSLAASQKPDGSGAARAISPPSSVP